VTEKLREIEHEQNVLRTVRMFYLKKGRSGLLMRHGFMLVGVIVGAVWLLLDPKAGADYFRLLAIGMGAYIVMLAARIVVVNFKIARKVTGNPTALLPLHIMAIATSYILLIVSTHTWVIARWGREEFFWYGLPLIVVADVIGVFALGVMWRFQIEKREAVK